MRTTITIMHRAERGFAGAAVGIWKLLLGALFGVLLGLALVVGFIAVDFLIN
jgi:hypothetical protein